MIKRFRFCHLSLVRLAFVFLFMVSQEGHADPKEWLAAIDAKIFGQSVEEESFHQGVALYKANKMDEALAAFQAAAQSSDRPLKAKALHNAGLIQIEKKEAEPALKSLRDAAAFDNESVEIKENLQWLLAHIKEEEIKKKQEQDQKHDQNQQKSEDQKTAEQKEEESKEQKSQPANEKQGDEQKKDQKGEQKSAESKEQGKDGKKGDEKKVAEESKDGSKKAAEDAEKKAEASDPKKDGDKGENEDKPAMAAKDAPSESEKDNPSERQMILTPGEIKQQEAERLLRTIDDRIGRYPLTDTEATSKRGNDGKNW
ncbi:MAG: hypothetical protein EOP10_12715 [Proteobacteria bacterium]|nr:MAG: hypothetical protein EOP10_12715 [Pseudomonadota bacterium]